MPETEIAAARRIRDLREWRRFLLHDSSVLKSDPSLLFQQAANQPDGTAPARAAQEILARGLISRPWIRWVNKASAAGPLVMTITGHADSIVSCAFSRDDRTISTASFDGDIRFWDVETGRESRRLSDLRYGLKACSFSPCGTRLAALNQLDKTVELRNAESGEIVASTPGHLVSRFSSDGKLFATALRKDLKVWRADTGAEVCALVGHSGRIMACAFSPDDRRLVSASDDNALKIWDAGTGRELATLSGHTWTVRFCAFSPDGKMIVSLADDETIRLWDAKSGALLRLVQGYSPRLKMCAFTSGGRGLVTPAGEDELTLWDTTSGKPLFHFTGPVKPITVIAVSPDGTRIAAGADDKILRIWSAEDGQEVAVLSGHDDNILDCAFSSTGRFIVSTSGDRKAKVWRAEKTGGGSAEDRHRQSVRKALFAPGGGLVLTASEDQTLKVWDGRTGALRGTLAGHKDNVYNCDISHKGTMAVSASNDGVPRTWDLRTLRKMATFLGHETGGGKCVFSPDGLRVATASFDSKLMLWDPFTGVKIAGFVSKGTDMRDFAFSPDGSTLVISEKENAELVSSRSGKPISSRHVMDYPRNGVVPDVRCIVSPFGDRVAVLDLAAGLKHVVYSLPEWRETVLGEVRPEDFSSWRVTFESESDFSRDGRIFAAPGTKTLFVWDADSGERIAAVDYPQGSVLGSKGPRHFALSDDGARVVCQGSERTLLWDLAGRRQITVLDVLQASIRSFTFSPDGAWVLACLEDGLRIWDAETGLRAGDFAAGSRVGGLSWSPDGRRLAAGTSNGGFFLLELQNMRSGRPLAFAWIGPPEKRGLFRRAAAPGPPGVDVRCPLCLGWSEYPIAALGGESDCASCGRKLRISPKSFEADKRRVS